MEHRSQADYQVLDSHSTCDEDNQGRDNCRRKDVTRAQDAVDVADAPVVAAADDGDVIADAVAAAETDCIAACSGSKVIDRKSVV